MKSSLDQMRLFISTFISLHSFQLVVIETNQSIFCKKAVFTSFDGHQENKINAFMIAFTIKDFLL